MYALERARAGVTTIVSLFFFTPAHSWKHHATWRGRLRGVRKTKFWCCWVFFFFFFFFFFLLKSRLQSHFFSGELWSILVVRLAHSADLRSRLRHVSSAPSVAYSTVVQTHCSKENKNSAQLSVVSTPTGMEVFPPLPHDRLSLQRPFSVADHGRSVEKNCKNRYKKRKWEGSATASALCEECLRPSNPALLPAVNHQGPSNDCPCVVSKGLGGPTVVQGLSKHVQWLGRELPNYAFIVCDLQAFSSNRQRMRLLAEG